MAGSLRERSPGVWELRVSGGFDAVTGKRVTVSRTFRGTERQASKALAKLVTEVEEDRVPMTDPNVTLTTAVEALLERWAGSPTTLVGYRSILENHIRPTIGRTPLRRLDARLLDDFYRYLETDKGLSPARITRIHALVRSTLRMAVRWGWLTSNPARDAKPPQVVATEITVPKPEVVAKLLDEADRFDPAAGASFRLAAATGARRSEICGLRWHDVDLRGRTLRIERAVVSVAGAPVEKSTKNHSKRTISLDPATVEVLRSHRAAMAERARTCGYDLSDEAYVFSNQPDCRSPLHPDVMSARWESVCREAKVEGVRLHDLRHFQATMLLAAGVPVKNVSTRIGHRNAATTLNIYAHSLQDADEAAADLIGNLLTAATEKHRASVAESPEQPERPKRRARRASGGAKA